MNPNKEEQLIKILTTSPAKKFGVSYPTIRRWMETGLYSAELCMKVEEHTDGEITAVMIRPELFIPTPAIKVLAKCCVDNFSYYMSDDKHELIIATLNYIENQSPDLYEQTLEEITSFCEGGQLFVSQRLTNKQYEI